MGDRGIPASYRHMNGYGSHTYQWTNSRGEAFFVKYHFKTNQGIRSLSSEQAAEIAGKDPNSHQTDLLQAIERGVHPSWTLHVQLMPAAEAADYRFNPFDLTKVWPHQDYPLRRVGRLVLDRNPDNVFAEVEQATDRVDLRPLGVHLVRGQDRFPVGRALHNGGRRGAVARPEVRLAHVDAQEGHRALGELPAVEGGEGS